MKPCSTYPMLQNRQCCRLVVLAQFDETDFSVMRFPQKTEKTIHNFVFKSKKKRINSLDICQNSKNLPHFEFWADQTFFKKRVASFSR